MVKTTRPPAGLLGAALVFWGWQTNVLWYAITMACVIEIAHWVSWRFDLDDKDFHRVTDLTSVGLIVLIVQQFDKHSFHAVYSVLALLPFVVFSLLALQLYSTYRGVKFTALFLSVRRAVKRGQVVEERSVDLCYPFFIVCLLSASVGARQSGWFYAGVCLLAAVALWHHRPRTYARRVWLALIPIAALLGFAGHQGALKARWMLEPLVLDWVQEHFWHGRNPFRGYTAIGSIGRLKQSNRIVLRVTPAVFHEYPRLLREATYQSFSHNTWLAGGRSFEPLAPVSEGTEWHLAPAREPFRIVEIVSSLHRGKGLISVPNGAFRIQRLGVEDLGVNALGTLKVDRGPGLLDYRVSYSPGRSTDTPPNKHDLHVPDYFDGDIHKLATQFGLSNETVAESLRTLKRHFQDNFSYSLELTRTSDHPLIDFLENSRSGHCEYFASASVLLLRAAGIPARYATGYSVQEFSEFEQRFLVRKRHAHSWALVYVDGAWRDYDTTPTVWGELEADEAPWWEPAADVFSWLAFQFSRWRWNEDEDETSEPLLWLLVPLLLIFVWRVARHQRVARRTSKRRNESPAEMTGTQSSFYRIVARLQVLGLTKARGETLQSWLQHLSASGQVEGLEVALRDILPLHYRYRFDARTMAETDKARLRELVDGWLARYATE